MPVLEVDNLSVHFPTRAGLVRAVDGASFAVERGETLGIVGESGSGKSVTALSIVQLLDPPGRVVAGAIRLNGEDLLRKPERDMLHVRGKRVATIFQEPSTSLNPTLTVGEQLLEALKTRTYDAWRAGALRGLGRAVRDRFAPDRAYNAWVRAEAIALLEAVRMPAPADVFRRYPYMMSGGMLQRAMIAIAIASQPELLIADEPTTALDVTIQAQILDILRERKEAGNLTMLLITHDLGLVAEMCDRVAVMYAGRIVEQGRTEALFDTPRHPYTRGLLASMPSVDRPAEKLTAIEGVVPDPIGLEPSSCYFASRCPLATDVGRCERPPMTEVAPGHEVACHVYSHPAMRSKLGALHDLWPPAPVPAGDDPRLVSAHDRGAGRVERGIP